MVARLRLVIVVGVTSLTACDPGITGMRCSDVEAEAVAISHGQLIKITHSHLVSRTPSRIVCRGMGSYSDDTDVMTTYRAYIDDEGESMVAYDADDSTETD